MEKTFENNKRIAKNTMFLYLRMLISMIVSLYTSRIVLNALGVEDYGILGVVGGIVSMFLLLNNALSSSTSRFLTYAIGENDIKKLNIYFNSSILIHIVVAIFIIILSETIGLWLLNHKLIIPNEKIEISHYVYHFSVFTSVLSILIVPYTALIISYERMNIFAYLTISDTIFKLLIAWLVQSINADRLLFYSFFLLLVSLFNSSFYVLYCIFRFKQIKHRIVFEGKIYKSIFSFTSWSLVGNLAYIGYTQGLNILLNMFFGPVVNAARGISLQIEQTIRTFTNNFQTAINPRIIKSFASKNLEEMHTLVIYSSKYSFFLVFLFALPILLETNTILTLWLGKIPDYTVTFVRIMMFIVIMETMSNSIMTSIIATGDIKKYHLIVGTILLMIVPFSYIVLKIGYPPFSVFIVYFIIEIFSCVIRLILVSPKIKMSKKIFFKESILKCFYVFISSSIIPSIIFYNLSASLLRFCLILLFSIISLIFSIYFFGLSKREKSFFKSKLKQIRKNRCV